MAETKGAGIEDVVTAGPPVAVVTVPEGELAITVGAGLLFVVSCNPMVLVPTTPREYVVRMADALVRTAITELPARLVLPITVTEGLGTTVENVPGRVTTARGPALLGPPLLSPLGPAPSDLGFLTTVVPLGKTRLKFVGLFLSEGGRFGGLLLTGIAIARTGKLSLLNCPLMADMAFSGDIILFKTFF